MSNLQYINDSNGKPLFVILPIEQFEEMELLSRFAIESKEEQAQWEDIPVEANKADEQGDTIPNEIVNIMINEDVSLLGAWRIYRKLSQYDVAKQTGLTQSAISQAERKESKPQRKTLERLAKVYDCKPTQLTL
ncbi:transcriptional regulator [Actinobacillus seminis]|uniref:Transcriptional regulator n=1 Tax=Actinobacillus seminis TaxID=722 RepID=A0A263HD78_9PAST|nr:helix-turn-helix transcriptional regulator [Actinobacillus seminis]OZN24898.1 transcriptional regulator [Actinobacillus seminis]SUU36597.1 transcriptional repressor DicA [Actinobacillus seminis]